MTAHAIEARNLVMRYGDVQAVDNLTMHVAEGEIVAFLGPNGAGKTTTVEILEGYRMRTSGSVSVLGQDPASAPRSWYERIGIVLQESNPYPELTAMEAVRMQGHYYADSQRQPEEIIELVGLTEQAATRTRRLSGGQQRRLDLAMALVGDPDLVFLDEPTTGFDPKSRRHAWDMIESLRQLGKTVLLTTHYMDEAQHLADRIVVIAAGKVVAEGTAEALADQVHATPSIRWVAQNDDPVPPEQLGWTRNGSQFTIATKETTTVTHALTTWAVEQDLTLENLTISHPTLEDVYLALTSSAEHELSAADAKETR